MILRRCGGWDSIKRGRDEGETNGAETRGRRGVLLVCSSGGVNVVRREGAKQVVGRAVFFFVVRVSTVSRAKTRAEKTQ